ncbi:MAG TPA: VanZ family protein [Candidatus Binataceae bacterium]|nr:VanZ family protein [Candidatus Binataceae bacterium]
MTRSKWYPVLGWCVVIFALSTTWFSAANTSRVIEPIFGMLFPAMTPAAIGVCHVLTRKLAHFTIYAVLYWLLARGPLAGRPGLALLLCVIFALTDEGHQYFVMGRNASLYDVGLDSSGALFSRFLITAIK